MSIRHGLLALLQQEPTHGYQLRADFEGVTGATWPLNVGQVYSTLTRLERDGLVDSLGEDSDGRVRYTITDAGRSELTSWFASPVSAASRPRDELAIKLALAVTVPGVDVARVIQVQRSATISTLQDLTRLKQQSDDDLSWSLVLESMRYHAEAEVRWLDHCETALTRAASKRDRETTRPSADAKQSKQEVRR